jgi:hypothetical protein
METQTESQEQTQKTEDQGIPNRRDRRANLKKQGILKYLSKKSFLDPIRAGFRADSMKNGKSIQDKRWADIETKWEESFGDKLESMRETWYGIGYNKSEVELLEEAATISFVKNKETYREDKNEAKLLRNKAKQSLLSRKTK